MRHAAAKKRRPFSVTVWSRPIVAHMAILGLVVGPRALVAQTIEGQTVSVVDGRVVSGVVVRLLDHSGGPLTIAISDSIGGFLLEAPTAGIYRIEAEGFGYRTVTSPELNLPASGGRYTVEILMDPAPMELEGLTVEAQQLADWEVDRSLRLILGSSVSALRYQPIRRAEILDHAAKGHSLEDLMRWSNTTGVSVRYTSNGPCFSLRGRGCLDVYLNDLRLNRDFMGDIPLDLIYTIVVVTRTDPVMSGSAVRLYTEGWVR